MATAAEAALTVGTKALREMDTSMRQPVMLLSASLLTLLPAAEAM